jgi:hypothetical protein
MSPKLGSSMNFLESEGEVLKIKSMSALPDSSLQESGYACNLIPEVTGDKPHVAPMPLHNMEQQLKAVSISVEAL